MRDAFTKNERLAATAACALLVIWSMLDTPITAAIAGWGLAVGIAALLRMRSPGNRSLLVIGLDTIAIHVIVWITTYALSSGVMITLGGEPDALGTARAITVVPCLDAMRLVWTRNTRLWPKARNRAAEPPAREQTGS